MTNRFDPDPNQPYGSPEHPDVCKAASDRKAHQTKASWLMALIVLVLVLGTAAIAASSGFLTFLSVLGMFFFGTGAIISFSEQVTKAAELKAEEKQIRNKLEWQRQNEERIRMEELLDSDSFWKDWGEDVR